MQKGPLTQEASFSQTGFDLSAKTFFFSSFYEKSCAVVFEVKRGWDVGLNRSSARVLRVFFQSRFSLGEAARHSKPAAGAAWKRSG